MDVRVGLQRELDFLGAPQNKVCHCFQCFPIYYPWSDGTKCHNLCFLNVELFILFYFIFKLYIIVCWVLSQRFHSPLSLSSRGSLVICFLPHGWHHLHIWDYWYFSWQSWFQLVLIPAHRFSWCTLHIS